MSQQKQQFDNTNRWVIFKQENKNDDRDADYSGTLNVNGEEFFIDGWLKTSQGGKKMMSGRIKPKNRQGGGQRQQNRQQQPPEDDF